VVLEEPEFCHTDLVTGIVVTLQLPSSDHRSAALPKLAPTSNRKDGCLANGLFIETLHDQ